MLGSKEQWGKALAGARATTTSGKGALIMKTVSLLLASSRRITSNQPKPLDDKKVGATATVSSESVADLRKARRKAKQRKMDEQAGKLNPKLLEIYKKKTHFSKYVTIYIYIHTDITDFLAHIYLCNSHIRIL